MNKIDSELIGQLKAATADAGQRLFIDAGIGHMRLRVCAADGTELENEVLSSNRDLRATFAGHRIAERFGANADASVFVTGKLAHMVREALGGGQVFLHAAALWLAAREEAHRLNESLAMIDISASGYTLLGVNADGTLRDDLLVANPGCGAGTGVNLDRVLQKLGLDRGDVDTVLADYLGEAGRERRAKITVRADRCGVFGASATISDKNQGIPLAVALATTLKSEVLKVCRKLPSGFRRVILLGRFFKWRFARDCVEDCLREQGVIEIEYDPDNTRVLDAIHNLVERVGTDGLAQPDPRLLTTSGLDEYPAFAALKERCEAELRYLRVASPDIAVTAATELAQTPVHIGLDVGSTMAKVAMADDDGKIIFLDAYSNAGDTIATVKRIFADLAARGIAGLVVRSIGVTGSARYQVREALVRIYPNLAARIAVLVENYAHAHGSIDEARRHIASLKAAGVTGLNENFCLLVDIGGEDTKISTLALGAADLFNNAMNIKCSAGTGSLMDTLSALFGIAGAGEASRAAFAAPRAYAINATCAVFLVESAQKLQAQGVARGEILASASWAVVENMARTLWSQVDLPGNSVVLLHGQTMLSDPLPLAVVDRMRDYLGAPVYGLVPPYPGHRACLGLIHSMTSAAVAGAEPMPFAALLEAQFDKRIIQCKGAACSDPEAVCNRTSLKCRGSDGRHFSFTLGGCSAINELLARAKDRKEGRIVASIAPPRDTYKEIWDAIDARHPKSDDPRRLVIPRSFVVSEWAFLLARIFTGLGLPVHVDNVRDGDLSAAQPLFDIDSCAPHAGVVGQFHRLAAAPHGMILAPQIDRLPTGGMSLGRTCTLNQGGFAVARALAEVAHPEARIHLFHLDLSVLEAGALCDQLHDRLQAVFAAYGIAPDRKALETAIAAALVERTQMRAEIADLAADFIEEARAAGHKIALVVGREYLLNPGIYDSHVRRLLRDKQMAAIPSYVLDVELDAEFSHVYWRNPHLILSILRAVEGRRLHERLSHPRLRELFRAIEAGDDLLPVVQITTFCCGPDSTTLPLAAEVMKSRPFLLIQSDAIIKELAHLENRVNTYLRQLELGLHGKLDLGGEPFEVCSLDGLESQHPLSAETDVIYLPTLADNRVLTSVLRGAGFVCVDNYDETNDLQGIIKSGRKSLGDGVCAPMAAVYGDLLRAQSDFASRRASGDPLLAGKKRLLIFDNTGSGPCRQGQYVEMHKLAAYRDGHGRAAASDECAASANGAMRFLVAREADGYDIGIDEWVRLRMYQGAIAQGVLHDMLFAGAWCCRDFDEYRRFHGDYLRMKAEVYAALEAFRGPGSVASALVRMFGAPAKYLAYRLDGRDLAPIFSRFADRWLRRNPPHEKLLAVHVSGEVYMRVAQAEEIFRTLLSILGFGRFHLEVAPVWSYLDYLLEEAVGEVRDTISIDAATHARSGDERRGSSRREDRRQIARIDRLRETLRERVAGPLYAAAGLPLPKAAAATMNAAKEILPTLRPIGELGPYIGEVLMGLREGGDLFLNVAPGGCMVSAMGQVLAPALRHAGGGEGRIQHLFSTNGEVNSDLLAVAALKSLGPEAFFRKTHRMATNP